MIMKVASQYGDTPGGAVIVESLIRSLEEEARHPLTRRPWGNRRVYKTFDAALVRFRLMPEQPCDNPFIVEFIGRHSLRRTEDGWVWKFDSNAMGSRRFGEPVLEYLQAVGCRAALIFGEKNSSLVKRRPTCRRERPSSSARGETPRHARPAARLRHGGAYAARQLDVQRVCVGKPLCRVITYLTQHRKVDGLPWHCFICRTRLMLRAAESVITGREIFSKCVTVAGSLQLPHFPSLG